MSIENGPKGDVWNRLIRESANAEIEEPVTLDDIWEHGEPIGSDFGEKVFSYSADSEYSEDARKSGIHTAFCRGRKVPRAPGCP